MKPVPRVAVSAFAIASAFAIWGVLAFVTGALAEAPAGYGSTRFAGPEVVPSPACLAVAPTGEVYVGVDLNGSLGKGAGKGRIVRLTDGDHDGVADAHSVFAEIDNPRGLVAVGKRLYVLHTVIPRRSNVLEAMHLSVLRDEDWDGVADGKPEVLVRDVSPPKHNQDRGADHTTNGIRMGIDGWIYIAVGDFGVVGAEGADGTELTMLGGGIVRVRPDGTGLEVYTHGLRNIYDLAIDPFMNVFTRGNTNDGGGWNVRFIHHVQSGEYGYPVLFKHFTDEILPALADLGGGSGTGALYLHEPGWPERFNDVPLMADWGRNQVVAHHLTQDGASFVQEPETFLQVSQVSDLDVDGSGRLYVAAWDGAGYTGSDQKGFVERVVPAGWVHRPFPDLSRLGDAQLVELLGSGSATARFYASQALLGRPAQAVAGPVLALARDASMPRAARVAALLTAKQVAGAAANRYLVELAADPGLREFALRALADRKTQLAGVPAAPFVEGLEDADPRVQVAAAVGLGRRGKMEAAPALLAVSSPPSAGAGERFIGDDLDDAFDRSEGPHAQPQAATVLPHVAVRALVALGAWEACVAALDGPHRAGALWALRSMHVEEAVDALVRKLESTADAVLAHQIMGVLARLYQREAPYDGSWWWGTRPDTRGPYYKPETWGRSKLIADTVRGRWGRADDAEKALIARLNTMNRMDLPGIEAPELAGAGAGEEMSEEAAVDLGAIAQGVGEVGKMSIEDVMLALAEVEGDPARGKELYSRQGCTACHTTEKDEPLKGPFMGHVRSVLSREQIAESILKPNASIAQGFATVALTTKDGGGAVGFVTKETADTIEMRDLAGQPTTFETADIASRQELETSIMPPALANALSIEDFASLVAYLAGQKE